MNITMTREQVIENINELEDAIMWAKTEYSSPQTTQWRRDEIDDDLFKDESELKDLQMMLEYIDNPCDDCQCPNCICDDMPDNDPPPAHKLDFNNIANLFFAVELMNTAFAKVKDHTLIKSENKVLTLINGFWTITAIDETYIRIEITDTNMSLSTAKNLGFELIEAEKIGRDIKKYWFSTPDFSVVTEIGRDCPF